MTKTTLSIGAFDPLIPKPSSPRGNTAPAPAKVPAPPARIAPAKKIQIGPTDI